MLTETLRSHISHSISSALAVPFHITDVHRVSGGSINECFHIVGAGHAFFVKCHKVALLPMFEAEAAGLEAMQRTGCVRVPGICALGSDDTHAWLVMEWLPAAGATQDSAARLGEQLAALHRVSHAQFGWQQNNTIGLTPQPNPWCADWPDFWAEHRIGHQLRLARDNRLSQRLQQLGEPLLESIPAFFADYTPEPSLLHGDLWGGNWHTAADGAPVLFDPAVYFGDREADLAMTELFGGFPVAFYDAYVAAWPLDAGYAVRRTLYNLYHILNHANLFGGGYVRQAEGMMAQLLAEVR